jgi:hypothetical protein
MHNPQTRGGSAATAIIVVVEEPALPMAASPASRGTLVREVECTDCGVELEL